MPIDDDDARPEFNLTVWRTRLREHASHAEEQHRRYADASRPFPDAVAAMHATWMAWKALSGDRALDRVWTQLARDERRWMTVTPFRNPYDALSRVAQDACRPVEVIARPTPERLEPFRIAVAKVLAACDRDAGMVGAMPELSELRVLAVRSRAAIKAVSDGAYRTTLTPAREAGADTHRNWIALWLRDETFPNYFNKPHHAAIAAIVNTATHQASPMSGDQVRLLRRGMT